MKLKCFTASLLASAMFAGLGMSPVLAQGVNTPSIDRAQQSITARIQQGLGSGHITPSEARELYRLDREIDIRESRFKANGQATPQERQQLRVELDALGAKVERLMANREVVAPPGNVNARGIDSRQFNISERIEEGVRTGRISQREARRLQRRERDIERHEANFKRDGVVTQQERRQLRNELIRLQDDVQGMMQNNRRRGQY